MIETATYSEMKEIIKSRRIYPSIIEYNDYVVIIASDGIIDARYNVLKKSSEFGDLVLDNWKNVKREVTSSGGKLINQITQALREPVVGLAAQSNLDKVITNVTSNTIEFASDPLVSQQITAPVNSGDFSISVGDSSVFNVGMRVVIEEVGKQLSIGIVENLPNGTTVNIVPAAKDNYTTSAILRQCVKGRQVLIDYGNKLNKFTVTTCTPTIITLDNRGIDLTNLTQIGNTIRFVEEELIVTSMIMSGDNDAAYTLDIVSQEFYGDTNRHLIFESFGKSLPQTSSKVSVLGTNYGYFIGSAYDFKQKVPTVSITIQGEIWS